MSSSYGAIDSSSWAEYAKLLDHTQNNTGKSTLEVKSLPVLTSCRWMIAYICFAGSVVIISLQQDMSMSLVCMFPRKETSSNDTEVGGTSVLAVNTTTVSQPSLDWTEETQGLILSAQFYGGLLSPIIAGYLSTRYGGKVIIIVCTGVAVVSTITTPVAAWWSPWMVFALRVILGFCTGTYNPAVQALLTKWAPVHDRAKMIAFCFSGVNLGNMISYVIPGLVCKLPLAGGWPLVYYIFSGVASVWILLVLFSVYDSPEQHPRVSEIERYYIMSGMTGTHRKEIRRLPWKHMIKSVPLWVCLIGQFVNMFCQIVQQLNIPMYMRDVLQFSIEQNGLLSALPAFGRLIGTLLSGFASDFVIKRKYLSVSLTRKLFFIIGFVLPGGALFGLSYLGSEQRGFAVVLLISAGTSSAAGMLTLRILLTDIAPRYASILLGILMTVSGLAGIITPVLVTILTNQGTQEQWKVVFYLCAGLYVFATLVFLIFGSSDEQWWSVDTEDSVALLGEQARGKHFRNGYVVTNQLIIPDPNSDLSISEDSARGKGQTFLHSS